MTDRTPQTPFSPAFVERPRHRGRVIDPEELPTQTDYAAWQLGQGNIVPPSARLVPSSVDPNAPLEDLGPHYYTTSESATSEQRQRVRETLNSKEDEDMSKPVLFYGKPDQLRQVLTHCKLHFLTDSDYDDDTARQAAYFAKTFRGQPLDWLAKKLETNDSLLDSYDSFVQIVKNHFGFSNDTILQQADRKIANIQQRTSVQRYSLEFRELADILNWNESAKIAHFKRGLKLHIRNALIARGNSYTALNSIIADAQAIDDESFSLKRNFNPSRGRGTGRGRGGQRRGFQGKCNKCGQFGHKARDCTSDKDRDW